MGGADGNCSWEESVDNQRVSSAPGRPGLAWHGPLPDKYFGEFRFRKFWKYFLFLLIINQTKILQNRTISFTNFKVKAVMKKESLSKSTNINAVVAQCNLYLSKSDMDF